MIDIETLNKIETLISVKKVAVYKEKHLDQWFDAYKLEIEKAKEAFIYLHFLEIFLRNSISTEFSADFGDWLFDEESKLSLNLKEQKKVEKAVLELRRMKKEINLDNIVSSLNFGFWTNLFHKSYNYPAWQQNKMIERVFPFLNSNERSLVKIQKEMEAIRKFRNRIFHFESMQTCNFEEMRKLIDKFIYGISGTKVSDLTK